MSLIKFEIIAVDANPIISALIGGKALTALDSSSVGRFITTEFTLNEVRKYIPVLANKPKLQRAEITEGEMLTALEAIPIEVYPRKFYRSFVGHAKDRIKDPKDVDILALALKTEAVIWTNDPHFNNYGVPIIDTAKLLKAI